MGSSSDPHSYRDFVDLDQPMYLSDHEILTALQDRTHVTPHQLAESRYRENVIRLQLRDLDTAGAVTKIGHEVYQSNSTGNKLLSDYPTHFENGLLDITQYATDVFPAPDWRIRDFSSIDAEIIKQLNRGIYQEDESMYGHVRQDEPGLTGRRIQNVSESEIHRIIREFPTTASLPEACAHWVRAIVGLHLFPDANHRTATNSLEYLLELSGGPSDRIISEEIPRFVLHSKYTRIFQSDVRFNTLWAKDELFAVWYRYFTQRLCPGLESRTEFMPSTEALDDVLDTAREALVSMENNH